MVGTRTSGEDEKELERRGDGREEERNASCEKDMERREEEVVDFNTAYRVRLPAVEVSVVAIGG